MTDSIDYDKQTKDQPATVITLKSVLSGSEHKAYDDGISPASQLPNMRRRRLNDQLKRRKKGKRVFFVVDVQPAFKVFEDDMGEIRRKRVRVVGGMDAEDLKMYAWGEDQDAELEANLQAKADRKAQSHAQSTVGAQEAKNAAEAQRMATAVVAAAMAAQNAPAPAPEPDPDDSDS